MKSKACYCFLALYVLFFISLLIIVLCTEQADLHLSLTTLWNGTAQDIFFKYITELGASVPFFVAVLLLFYRVGDAVVVLVAQLATSLVVYPIKSLVAAPRPSLLFSTNFPDVVLHKVDGVTTLYQMNSFPSGHTAAVFSLMLCLTLIFNKKTWLSPIFFVLAVLTAYSRVYLSQHFAEDVLAGSAIGVAMTLLIFMFYKRKTYVWEEKTLIELCRRSVK
ncbi:MAG: phosphatase PAP2 family protein [Paludibacteraceae bacterium]|jgi:membrane-associated phospholipid phosphatase|nr:phosphatase PAP2 family protein [Paludibacteraceae bacterium]MDI9536960.1 phosphatase PAP2 family protein [Bacteroidota bacterium]OQC34257.1 MAG: undecaprenyl pyrophosphate phosphatase [Bacteroidetes bacterium ADurb.Bin057]HHT61561.1 phosphatase PAP2 family protein [Bacteroidales bacterium]MBP9040067.1 phosphatase PAP2 family protein [Paludibacteraceae bacterium]